MADAPIHFRWDGEAMVPLSPYWAARADRQFVVGEQYKLVEHSDRSDISHNHFFASIKNGYENLSDGLRDEFPSTEHLRKKALIRTGYRDERSIVCASESEAHRVAAFVEPIDDYSIVAVSECVVRIWTAKSQKRSAMDAKEFQQSKTAVLEFIDDLLGVERGETARSQAA